MIPTLVIKLEFYEDVGFKPVIVNSEGKTIYTGQIHKNPVDAFEEAMAYIFILGNNEDE